MNFISPEAIIENARYKKDKEPSDFQAIPYRMLVADNFEETMKKYLTNSSDKHYSSAYAEDINLNISNNQKYKIIPNNEKYKDISNNNEKYTPNIPGINIGEIKTNAGNYEIVKPTIPDNACGNKFKELIVKDDSKKEKGISYPEYFTVKNQTVKVNIVSIIIIIILILIIIKMYMYICKLKFKNKLLKLKLGSNF